MLLGVGGSGRQSLSRLAAFILGYSVFAIEVVKGYGFAKWKEDLKGMVSTAMLKDISQVFILNDTQIFNENQLEDINSILSQGTISDLPFNLDEAKIIEDINRRECQKRQLVPNKINMAQVMAARLRQSIHIVLAMSPIQKEFSQRLRLFPGLINNSTLIWMTEWPAEALQGVAQ